MAALVHETSAVDRVLLAAPRSFCAGVEMAIKALAWMVRTFEAPVYCYHEIVHNQVVVDRFRRAGVVFVDGLEEVPAGAPLMLSAHGSAPELVAAARARSGLVVDAVCPLVKKVHHEVRQRGDKGHLIIYAGHASHDEAVGTLAVAPGSTYLVESPADVDALDLAVGDGAPVAFLAQTTLGVDEWRDIMHATTERFGDVWVPGRSDLCFATTNRQAAVRAIAPRCDAIVVIGSENSSNTLALARVAESLIGGGGASGRTDGRDGRVVRVNGADELPHDLCGTVGVTAGASAPEDVVQAVLARLAPRDGIEVVDATSEDEYFPPPRELRDLLRSRGEEAVLDNDRGIAASTVLYGLPERRAAGSEARALAELEAYVGPIDDCIADVIETEVADPWLRDAIAYHLGWRDERFAPLSLVDRARSGGKKLRAALAVLAFRAVAPDEPIDRVVPFAAAVELVHNWSLVHDDIEDGDRTRRGRPALWTLCGEPHAINAGDCIYALAFRALARLADHGLPETQVAALMAEVARAAVDLTVGQMRDLTYETVIDVGVERYLEMIAGKTGALLRCATFGGALVACGDPAVAQLFGEFGRHLGFGFQIRDDILGIWGDDAETGKPTGSDIRRRKKTLPVVTALAAAVAPADRDRLHRLYADTAPLTPDDEAFVHRILEVCGARAQAQRAADRHRAEAVAQLPSFAAAPHVTGLHAIADFVTQRAR
jgi:4-hydroxy-3-methylbut-2-enyl diphosphate reductase